MLRYILRRLALIPFSLALVNALSFLYAHFTQWQYAERYPILRYRIITLRGQTEAFWPAYREYLTGLMRLDWGKMPSGESLAVVLQQTTIASLGLLLLALTFSILMGLGLGFSAVNARRQRPARWLTMLATGGLAMPSFYIGSLLILASVAYALWLGAGTGLLFPLAGFGWDSHLVLPVAALTLRPTVQLAQITAGLLVEELQKDYVTAAQSFGHPWWAIKRRLAFRNILAPVLLTAAGSLRMLVADLILVEWLFSWPGLGRMLAYVLIPPQITNQAGSPYFLDPPLMAGVVTVVTTLFLLADFVAATAVRWVDPRLREPAAGEVGDV